MPSIITFLKRKKIRFLQFFLGLWLMYVVPENSLYDEGKFISAQKSGHVSWWKALLVACHLLLIHISDTARVKPKWKAAVNTPLLFMEHWRARFPNLILKLTDLVSQFRCLLKTNNEFDVKNLKPDSWNWIPWNLLKVYRGMSFSEKSEENYNISEKKNAGKICVIYVFQNSFPNSCSLNIP